MSTKNTSKSRRPADGFGEFEAKVARIQSLTSAAAECYVATVQRLVNKHNVHLATGQMSDMWQVSEDGKKDWKDDMDEPKHPIFDDLERLDKIASEIGIGPTNLERYSPNEKSKLANCH